MSNHSVPDQRNYWDRNLDPANLGQSGKDLLRRFAAEEKFYLVPDRKIFLQEIDPSNHKICVEVGAGLSYQTFHLARLGFTVVACDISLERLRVLRTLAQAMLSDDEFRRIKFVACQAEEMPFRAGVIDVISTRAVLIHTDIERAVGECVRILSPCGVAVFSEPMKYNPLVNLYRCTLAPQEWRTIARYFTEDEVGLVSKRFPHVRVHFHYLFSFLAFVWQYGVAIPSLFWLSFRVLDVFDRALMRILPPLRKYVWFVTLVCRKSA
jgi:SAM-dependent methyltransferase